MPTVIASHKVQKDRIEEYRRILYRLNSMVREQPGFCGTEILSPVPEIQEDWITIFRFDTNENLQHWIKKPERSQLIDEISETLSEPVAFQIVAGNEGTHQPATAVFTHKIKPGRESDLADWKRRIIKARTSYPGHLDSEMFPPVPGVQEDWIDIVRFDSPENLKAWMRSPERKELLEEAREFSEKIEAKPLATGLESWFRLKGNTGAEETPTPIWKQSLLVLLTLYPTAFLVYKITDPLLSPLARPIHLLITNIVGVSILAYLLLPRVSRCMAFWLHPSIFRPRWQTNLLGIGIVLGTLGLLLTAFTLIEIR